jgi:hypothetical protein
MLYYGFPHKVAPLVVLRFLAQSGPFCTMWFRQFTKNVTNLRRLLVEHHSFSDMRPGLDPMNSFL